MSSPITQWRKKVMHIVDTTYDVGWMDNTRDGVLSHTSKKQRAENIEQALGVITSATIELIEGLIGEDEPTNYPNCECNCHAAGHGATVQYAGAPCNLDANHLRSQLRQSLKEL